MEGSLKFYLDPGKMIEAGFLIRCEDGRLAKTDKENWPHPLDFSIDSEEQKVYKVFQRIELDEVRIEDGRDYQRLSNSVDWWGPVPKEPERDLGIYFWESAWGKLDGCLDHPEFWWLKIEGQRLEAIQSFYFNFRAGKILPMKDRNWSRRQGED